MNRVHRGSETKPIRPIPGSDFLIGSDRHYPEEAPTRRVRVAPFAMDEMAVTDRQFATFVQATGYVTIAERSPYPAAYPGTAPEALAPGSLVFRMTAGPVDIHDPSIRGRKDHPVVQVAFEDAAAYAAWAGKALPKEAELEFAARGGLGGAEFAWGDALAPHGRHLTNTRQGESPGRDASSAGSAGGCPFKSYPPNGYGLYEVCGNVWEWTTDWYAARHAPERAAAPPGCCAGENAGGPRSEASRDPAHGGDRDPAQGGQGRLLSLRPLLLPPLPTRGATPPDGRHRHEPYRLPLRPPPRAHASAMTPGRHTC